MISTSKIATGDARRGRVRRSGQVVIFLVTMLVILFFVVVWNFDLHTIIRVKQLSQNAGDSSSLMAARWQGITMNLIGDLNLMKAAALAADDRATVTTVDDVQARLCLVGPMIGFMAVQQVAKNNGIYANPDFTELLREHAVRVRTDYPTAVGPSGELLFPEPYPGAWTEYADMLDLLVAEGVAAGPDNARFYSDYGDGHFLLMQEFYDAIAGRTWCWFYHNAPTLLTDYENFFPCWWSPLPEIREPECINCEYFGLGLTKPTTTVSRVIGSIADLTEIGSSRGIPIAASSNLTNAVGWYCYGGAWGDWDAMSTAGADPFPLTGPVRPEYNYAGADAVVRIVTSAHRLTPGPEGASMTNTIVWTAAAKPLGYLEPSQRPDTHALVMPAFRNVRLIPLDAASGSGGGSYDVQWQKHIRIHLPEYMVSGLGGLVSGCWYCDQLRTWENASFRAEGVAWLAEYSWQCIPRGGGGGGGGGGGRRRGH
jgi:cellobiose-specific phosphotransferase system component IIB